MNKIIALAEQHVEKAILGLAALFAAYSAWAYLLQSPNQVEFASRTLGPRELNAAVLAEAEKLKQKMDSASAEEASGDRFADLVRRKHAAGIFDGSGGLAPELRPTTVMGRKIEVPGLEDAEEAPGSIALVRPLKPTAPVAITGRSLAVRKPLRLDDSSVPPPAPTPGSPTAAAPVETVWASVAVYFDPKAQFNEMIKSGYPPFRSRAYVAGLELERQEMLSNGQWSDWTPVKTAAPQFTLPEPAIDDATGKLLNKDELDKAFQLVKSKQDTLMQPPFHDVKAGDFWEVPPIAGFEKDPDEEEQKEAKPEPKKPDPPPARPTLGGRPVGGGGGGGGPTFGGGGGGRSRGGASPTPRPAAPPPSESKADALKRTKEALAEAASALNRGEYQRAIETARAIEDNDDNQKGFRNKAEKIRKRAEQLMERRQKAGQDGGLIKHPETGVPALWAHDDTVESGKTYRYRARVLLWNRYVGNLRAMKDPADARKTVVPGDWSLIGDPITVRPSTYFFVRGPKIGTDAASLEVWKWRDGSWVSQAFDVERGGAIGGPVTGVRTGDFDAKGDEVRADVDFTTGAIVLDIRTDETVMERIKGSDGSFTYTPKTSMVVTYLDPADGQVKERVQLFERYDPVKKELEAQEL